MCGSESKFLNSTRQNQLTFFWNLGICHKGGGSTGGECRRNLDARVSE